MKRKNASHRNALPIVLLGVVMAALFTLALFGLHRVGLVELPFISSGEESTELEGQEIEAILNSLSVKESGGETVFVMLDSSVIKDVLATGKAGNQYLHEYTVTYGDSESYSVYCSVLRKNSDFHLTEFRNGMLTREIKLVGGKAEISDYRVGLTESFDTVPSGFFEQSTGCISVIDLINFVINYQPGETVTWKMGTVKNCVVETVREESVNMARITMVYEDRRDVYMLDIDRSALYSCESYVGDALVSHLKTTKISYDIGNSDLDFLSK